MYDGRWSVMYVASGLYNTVVATVLPAEVLVKNGCDLSICHDRNKVNLGWVTLGVI